MNFAIDKQTLEELNLTGKFKTGSVYNLFNKVKTTGGERLLDNMFRHPLVDESAINERSSIFQFFEKSNLSFPFDVQQVSMMREYIDTTSLPSPLWFFIFTIPYRKKKRSTCEP